MAGGACSPTKASEGSPTNPSNMQYELVIIQNDNNHDEITSRRSIFSISYHNGTASAWQAGTKVLITQ